MDELTKAMKQNGLKTIEDFLCFPKYLQIETVSTCNARCIMCPVEEWERDSKLMSDELYDKILKEIEPFADWIEMITVQLDGEPLIDKKLESRVQALKQIGIKKVTISSNASLMTPKRAETILRSGMDEITFSIDGATKETFELIRIGLDYDECISNVISFISLRNKLAPEVPVRIRMAIMEQNIDEFNQYKDFWQSHMGPLDMAYGRLSHNWARGSDNYSLPDVQVESELNGLPCPSPWTSLVILCDGRVPLCCIDFNASKKLGNVLDSLIQSIWQNQLMAKIRDSHAKHGRSSMLMCTNCNVWDDSSRVTEKIPVPL
ncbi:MAG: radical SAM protein [Kiritimatiellia bacterium]|jgi:MoaA/NifB/PqqE/SkfB family radical SAM enzyme|nr:radical SAM protein [Kiritimatiellia bacterium]MDP6781504.1 radical SAM protein [Alphaproteobacteria bacterium]|tara:strand:+ start:84 stop:1040 length:957 start_codon:yes stop_codon:yes gene_type:complete